MRRFSHALAKHDYTICSINMIIYVCMNHMDRRLVVHGHLNFGFVPYRRWCAGAVLAGTGNRAKAGAAGAAMAGTGAGVRAG